MIIHKKQINKYKKTKNKINLALDSYHISCFPILFVNVSLLPCWIYPYFIRSYILWFRSKTSQATVYQNAVLSKENGDQELIQGSSRIASWFLSKKWTSKMPFQIVLVSIIFLLSLGLTLLMYFFDPFVWPEDIRADYSMFNFFKIYFLAFFLFIFFFNLRKKKKKN